MPATFRPLLSSNDPHWGALIDLYVASFPLDERDPIESLEREAAGKGRLPVRFVVAEDDGVLVGFSRSVYLPDCEAIWLIHIAVDPEYQSSGVGAGLIAHLRAERPNVPLIAEVDRLEDSKSEEDLRLRERRLRWFRSFGAHTITRGYTQPALGEEGRPVRLYLLRIGESAIPHPQLIQRFYEEAWDLEPEHHYVVAALGALV